MGITFLNILGHVSGKFFCKRSRFLAIKFISKFKENHLPLKGTDINTYLFENNLILLCVLLLSIKGYAPILEMYKLY